ncbi:MAG TPA: ATP-binding cassette domain-containing protein, partial [Candidatus Fimicola cottocaccae]|nr:ATP-binding cassette domain-containing protein [Candidatus Fimicola cottocaccae]
MDNALCIKSLTKEFEGFKLDNITMNVPKGSIMGLIGENGAGKTTIIKCILGVINKDSGNISVMGNDIDDKDNSYKENLGVVFDENSFNELYNAKDVNKIFKGIYKNWNENQFFDYID